MATKRKIYQVCKEYYDYPGSSIIKTFSSKKKAEEFAKEYRKSDEWKQSRSDTECIAINEYEVR